MSDRVLRLRLSAGEHLPSNVPWRIDDGYLRVSSWGDHAEHFTLGLWGPGQLVIPSVRVEAHDPTQAEKQLFLEDQVQQASKLLQLTRVRPAELRLFSLLIWLGQHFGRVNRRGISLSFDDMNLTHRHLAELAGLTRVTVTKVLSRFRQDGVLLSEGNDELLLPERCVDLGWFS